MTMLLKLGSSLRFGLKKKKPKMLVLYFLTYNMPPDITHDLFLGKQNVEKRFFSRVMAA